MATETTVFTMEMFTPCVASFEFLILCVRSVLLFSYGFRLLLYNIYNVGYFYLTIKNREKFSFLSFIDNQIV